MSASTKVATGNIAPSRFVALSTAGDGKVAQAGAGAVTYGISGAGTRNTPYSSLDDGYHAIAGENVHVFGFGDRCWLEIVAAVVRGDQLKSDTNGKGTPVSANNDFYGAVALQSGAAGDLIEVEIRTGYYGA